MFQRLVRKLRGPPSLTAYEREVLETEHRRLASRLDRLEGSLGQVHCSTCVKDEDPRAQRLLAEMRATRKTLDDIEWKLGYAPEPKSKRVQGRRARRA